MWLRQHEPQIFAAAHRFIHAADFVVGRLSSEYSTTDFSNALKTGYDVQHDCWPAFIETELGIPLAQLPAVVRPATPIASTSPECAAATGLPPGVPVLAGTTDGCASQISTGAVCPGDWNSTLGNHPGHQRGHRTSAARPARTHLQPSPSCRILATRRGQQYWRRSPGPAGNNRRGDGGGRFGGGGGVGTRG
ncbi:MAG: hypothetical protein JXM69_01565 [Anaerolineae bacterium]|nr:hypothetical protein [Anaerolineae bacterium]